MAYDINSNILVKTGYTADQLKAAEKAYSPGEGYHDDVWQAIVDAENKYGLNALFILAHADVESAHGTSHYATTRNNLFGFNAVDSNPDLASNYPTQASSVDHYANFLSTHYLKPGEVYYNGATPHGVFVKYSSSHDSEAQTVVQIMNALQARISGESAPIQTVVAAPEKPATPAATTYHVVAGDNLTKISKKFPGTTIDMWVSANRAKYPTITPGYIQAGWNLITPGGKPAVATAKYIVAKRGDTVSGWGFKAPYTEFKNLNPGVNPGKIYVGKTYRIK